VSQIASFLAGTCWHNRGSKSDYGVLAQLVERLNGIEEVRGSNPLGSKLLDWNDLRNRQVQLSPSTRTYLSLRELIYHACRVGQFAVQFSKVMRLHAFLIPASEGGYVSHNPETGTTSQGETAEEALSNLKEATELYLEECSPEFESSDRPPMLTTFEAVVLEHA
jgi:predicted RNase H-like HicB family nuclease